MRSWINLVENFDTKPSFSLAVTDELIHDIISMGKWVEHGSDIEDWWEQIRVDGDLIPVAGFPELLKKNFEEARRDPVFAEALRWTLTCSAEYYDGHLVLTGDTMVYRGLCNPNGFDPSTPLGKFWSTEEGQAIRFMSLDTKIGGTAVMMTAKLKDCTVNWPETIRSRLDQSGGDEEELQLEVGSEIFFTYQELVVHGVQDYNPVFKPVGNVQSGMGRV